MEKTRRIDWQQLVIYIGTVAVFMLFTILCAATGRSFLSWVNISNIIVQTSIIAILAAGASFVIITGGIDLSIGSIVGFCVMVMAVAMKAGVPVVGGVLLSLAIGLVMGLANGLLISYAKLPAFIATLGMLSIGRGGALAITGGKSLSGFDASLSKLANTTIAGIPIFIFYVAIVYVIFVLLAKKSKFGRYVYAIGGNRNAARLSGINVGKFETITYAVAGLLGGFASVMLLSRLVYASPTSGNGYELDVIAAAVIGGISLSGGQGKVINTLFGALILGILKCGLQMLNVSTFYQEIATGVVIILAVFFDKAKDRKAE
jgi:ribose transport system permease protein